MNIGLIVLVVALIFCFMTAKESFSDKDVFRNQRLVKGSSGFDFPGSGINSWELGGDPSRKETDYSRYSLYSTKVWPDTYQPVTNTCFDEYMATCSPRCNGIRNCVEDCQVRATAKCSKKSNIPKMVTHTY